MEEGLFYISNCSFAGGVGYSILLCDLQLFIITREIHASDTRLVYTCVHVLIFFYMSFLPILLSIYHDQHNQQLKYAKIFD